MSCIVEGTTIQGVDVCPQSWAENPDYFGES